MQQIPHHLCPKEGKTQCTVGVRCSGGQNIACSLLFFSLSRTLQALKDRVLSPPGLAQSLPCGILQPHTTFCLFSKYLRLLLLGISGVSSPSLAVPALAMRRCELHGIIRRQAVNKFGSPTKWGIAFVTTQWALMDLNGSNKHHQGSPPHSPCPRELEAQLSSALALQLLSELCCPSLACWFHIRLALLLW